MDNVLRTNSTIPKNSWLPSIAILNKTKTVIDKEIQSVTTALQVQIVRDFAPIWGKNASIKFYKNESDIPFDSWKFIFFDYPSDANELDSQELTSTGYPQGRVFVQDSVKAGIAWSISASHEMLEILLDPYTDLLVLNQEKKLLKMYAYEVCDPVEKDWYVIGGVKVSNFVYPEWFEKNAKNPSGKWDFLGNLDGPFTLSDGGYYSYMEIKSAGWKQKFDKSSNEFQVCRKNREFPNQIGVKIKPGFFMGLWEKLKAPFIGWEEVFSEKKNQIEAKNKSIKNSENSDDSESDIHEINFLNSTRHFSVLTGKVLKNIRVEDKQIYFETEDGKSYELHHEQECCENVRVESINGKIEDVIGAVLIEASESSKSDDESDKFQTISFYKLRTEKGSLAIQWRGESNGFYSEDVVFSEIDPL